MRKSIETLKNIWNIEDLRQRILITILFVAIYRFGSYVVLPGINPDMLSKLHEQTSEGLLALLNMFSGGAFSNASIFALGIMPYISASIVIQLLAIAVPYFQKLQREGESGRRKINQYTRILTIFILIFSAFLYIFFVNVHRSSFLDISSVASSFGHFGYISALFFGGQASFFKVSQLLFFMIFLLLLLQGTSCALH